MNILITGSTGFIGKHLVKRLERSHTLFTPGREFVILPELLKEKKIDGVIHLASHFVRNHSADDLPALYESNLLFGARILEAMKELPHVWFINTGTSWQNTGKNFDQPVNLYAATKTVFQNHLEKTSTPHVTLKLFDTYGPKDTRDKVLNLIHQSAQNGNALELSPGEQLLEMCFVEDVTIAFERMISLIHEPAMKGKTFGVPGERVSLRNLVTTYERATGKKVNVHWGARPYRENEIMIPWPSFEKIPGYKPCVTLEEGIRKTYV